jgi:hypothetical protein
LHTFAGRFSSLPSSRRYQIQAMDEIARLLDREPRRTVTTSRARQENMLLGLAEISSGKSTAFSFKTMGADDNHPTPGLLSEGWERAGHPPISIASQG